MENIPNKIYSGKWGKCHCQGTCMDTFHQYVYYSFTTKLVKTDLDGNVIATVDNIIGHLGCMQFNDVDGKVYASLEYKNDAIGKGILKSLGISEENADDGFYVAVFDVSKMDRIGMDAEKDGIMTAVYLKTVVDDYKGKTVAGGKEYDHIHGCSGIDGITIAPDFGAKDGKKYLYVCYGVYGQNDRPDNDYQVLLQYDLDGFLDDAKPLSQRVMHKFGPSKPRNKYFFYTGNTNYGIQNLEYDEYTGDFFVFVYRGAKPQFPNYDAFVIDGKIPAVTEKLKGYDDYEGKVLFTKDIGEKVGEVSGMYFPLGSMGAYSLKNGQFMLVDPIWDDPDDLSVNLVKYDLAINDGKYKFEKVEK
jgi:hypothetical protein